MIGNTHALGRATLPVKHEDIRPSGVSRNKVRSPRTEHHRSTVGAQALTRKHTTLCLLATTGNTCKFESTSQPIVDKDILPVISIPGNEVRYVRRKRYETTVCTDTATRTAPLIPLLTI